MLPDARQGYGAALLAQLETNGRLLARIVELLERDHGTATDTRVARLVRAIASSQIGGDSFSTGELLAMRDGEDELAGAILACGKHDARQLGKLLQAWQGHVLDGLVIVRVGEDRRGATWEVQVAAGESAGVDSRDSGMPSYLLQD
jgi:hypothetical protein